MNWLISLSHFSIGRIFQTSIFHSLPEQQSTELLTGAGILASYFASETQWRLLDIKPHIYQQKRDLNDQLLTAWGRHHAVVFMTNAQRPAAFKPLPEITQPRVELLDHPLYPQLKVLAVMAPDDAGLIDAAQALAAAAGSLSGAYATFNQFDAEPETLTLRLIGSRLSAKSNSLNW